MSDTVYRPYPDFYSNAYVVLSDIDCYFLTCHFLVGCNVLDDGHDDCCCHFCLCVCLQNHVTYQAYILQTYVPSCDITNIKFSCGQVLSMSDV